ncbi:hypothetical protein ABIF61_002068 [Bradyrhizobium japonicum]
MKVVRKNDKRIDRESLVPTRRCNSRAQRCDVLDEQPLLAVEKIDREEPATTRNKCTAIVWH